MVTVNNLLVGKLCVSEQIIAGIVVQPKLKRAVFYWALNLLKFFK